MKHLLSICLLPLAFLAAAASAQEAAPLPLTVMTFNLRYNNPQDGVNAWPNRKSLVASVFGDHQIDIAGLQEGLDGQVHDLQSELPSYAFIGVGRDDGQKKGEYAPIFYLQQKFAVEKQGTFWLSPTPEVPGSMGWDAKNRRIATWGIFRDKSSQRRFFVINTHFENGGTTARRNSAVLLMRRIPELNENLPTILTGDFNSTESDPVMQTIATNPDTKLVDTKRLSSTPHTGGDFTFNDFKPGGWKIAIDYIFVGPGITVQDHAYFQIMKSGVFVSDHWPVISHLTITK